MNLLDVVAKIGDDIARSQMFSCKNEAQGRVIALSCLTTGRDVLSVPEEYHLMNGKLTLQASAMLGRLVKCGGEYDVVEHSPSRCAIVIRYKGRKYEGQITWTDAQEEPFVYSGKSSDVLEVLGGPTEGRSKLKLSQNYATPRRRMQHLWARVVSDSVRVIAPDLVSGSYTPEEVADFSGLVTQDRVQQTTSSLASGQPASDLIWNVTAVRSDVAQTNDQFSASSGGMAVESQLTNIKYLLEKLEVPAAALNGIFSKRGVTCAAEMTQDQANDFIEFLRQKLEEKQAANPVETSTAAPTETAKTMHVDGPVTQELEERIRLKIKEVAQSNGQGKEFTDRIKLKLDASGMKLKDLTYNDASKLLSCLESMQIEEFFLHVLTMPEPGPSFHPEPGSEADSEPGNASGGSLS